MNDPAVALPQPLGSLELTPRDRAARLSWGAIVSGALSLALIVAVVHELAALDLARLRTLVPESPLFWGALAAYYLAGPFSEWLIFRRLWTIPASGIFALLRKKIYNELVLGYLGEVYFYGWARRRVEMTSAPFGAVKDVAILSAIAGNVVTLVLLVVMWPFIHLTELGIESHLLVWSLGIVLAISVGAMFLRRRVFSLPRADLVFIMWLHLARIGATIALLALLWHLALPAVSIVYWLFLATLRMLVSRLPLVPNNDLVFAGVAVFTLGHETDIGSLLALIAGLILATHLMVGVLVALADLARPDQVR